MVEPLVHLFAIYLGRNNAFSIIVFLECVNKKLIVSFEFACCFIMFRWL